MSSSTVACESTLLRALTGTPAGQWASLLEVFGSDVKVRPVDAKVVGTGACTVTSLLEGSHGVADSGSLKYLTSSTGGKMAPAPLHPARVEVAGARARARRQQPRPSEPPAEDLRDIEDLLRELGEVPVAPSAKSKDKAAAVKKIRGTAAESTTVSAFAPETAPADVGVEEKEAAKVFPDKVEGDLSALYLGDEVLPNATCAPLVQEEESVSESWQVVGPRSGRRGCAKQTSFEEAPVEEGASTALPKQVSWSDDAPFAGEKSSTSQCPQTHAQSERSSLPTNQRLSGGAEMVSHMAIQTGQVSILPDQATKGNEHISHSSEEEPGAIGRSKSEGALPFACQHVATDSIDVVEGDATAAQEGCAIAAEQVWHKRPSVGSWLRSVETPRPQEEEPHFFLATPESTPPASPRPATSQQVVWVPIPVHLLVSVQQMLFVNGALDPMSMHSFGSCMQVGAYSGTQGVPASLHGWG